MKKAINIIIIVLAIIALLCGFGLGYYYISSALQKKSFDNVRQTFLNAGENTDVIQTEGNDEKSSARENADKSKAVAMLKEQNSDLLGWLEVSGTKISYPVMYTPQDEEYYLRRSFEKKNSIAGTPFVDARYSIEPPSDNCIIYGHNMKDGTMFADLFKFQSENFYKENSKITLFKEDKTEQYSIVAVVEVDIFDPKTYDFYKFVDDDGNLKKDFFNNLYSAALHKTERELRADSKLLTLSTCMPNEADGRLIVVAVLD